MNVPIGQLAEPQVRELTDDEQVMQIVTALSRTLSDYNLNFDDRYQKAPKLKAVLEDVRGYVGKVLKEYL
jgi:RNA polymerase-interacting CarD/CdnL/TRCF family regulator